MLKLGQEAAFGPESNCASKLSSLRVSRIWALGLDPRLVLESRGLGNKRISQNNPSYPLVEFNIARIVNPFK